MRGQDQLSRLLDEFCALVFGILHPPPPLPVPFPEEASPLGRAAASSPPILSGGRRPPQVSAAGFASLLLGVSLALMLCGLVTFMIGFILMPWVLGLVVVLHFLGILSNLSALGRSIISPAPPSPKSPQKMSAPLVKKGCASLLETRRSDRTHGLLFSFPQMVSMKMREISVFPLRGQIFSKLPIM